MGWGEGCIEDIFANAPEPFVQLIPSQVGVYFLGRGTNKGLRAAQQPEAFLGEEMFLGRVLLVAAFNLALPI
jgi:hypothetical protein